MNSIKFDGNGKKEEKNLIIIFPNKENHLDQEKKENITYPKKKSKTILIPENLIKKNINHSNNSCFFANVIGKKRISNEISKRAIIKHYLKKREISRNNHFLCQKRAIEIEIISKQPKDKPKKEAKLLNSNKKAKNNDDLFLLAIGKTKESMEKAYYEKKRKEKEIENHSSNINEILRRNIMGNKIREFITITEEEKEVKNSYLPIDMSIPIPHINPIRKNNLEKYRNFHPNLNDIFKNVLSFNFYISERTIEEIPNTFENEAHYRYIWITDFFNELKYCLLNEKIENSEIQNYENADIRINLLKLNDIDSKLILFKINTNKKLYELKKRILKDNDIIAIFNEKSEFDKNKVTLKNEYVLNYFLGIVTRDYDSNDLNLFVLREQYEDYIKNDIKSDEDISLLYDKKIKYLGSINSPLREYKALLDLELSNFTSIIKTDTIFLLNKKEEINSRQNLNISNFYLSEKDIFLKNIEKSNIFNEPQKNAIFKANSMKNNDILLIQGPPGTGKTHTILGLVSLLLKNDKKSKILICAPSNAAIDEICARLARKGVLDSKLERKYCKFLRFGLYDRKDKEKKYLETLNGKILEKYSLEYLSDQKYKKDLDFLSEKLENLKRQLNNYNKDKNKNMINIKNKESEISFYLKLFMDKRYQKSLFEFEILTSIPILCTTLNNSGNERLKRAKLSYEYLIIDEASQCVEPSCLIPLCHEVKKFILVGDHMQLPATVFYSKASNILYNRSLFERLIDNRYPRYILTIQYRMQKNISEFISKTFYENKLINDESHSMNINQEIIYSIINQEKNFSFFDIPYSKEVFEEDKKSYFNKEEIKFSFDLIKKIISLIYSQIDNYQKSKEESMKDLSIIDENENTNNTSEKDEKNENSDYSINTNKVNKSKKIESLKNYRFAIICPYKSQVMKFKEYKKSDKFFNDIKYNDIEINTVDSFQGQERDIIIFSTVRSNCNNENEIIVINDEENFVSLETSDKAKNNENVVGIGFLNDFRRMNVGLSRAKFGCFVVGNFETLKNNTYWKKLINYCKEKNSFFQVKKSKALESIANILK